MISTRGLVSLALLALGVGHAGCSAADATVTPGEEAVTPACKNGKLDPGETGIDCGGTCGKCAGEPCVAASDCGSGSCTNAVCEPPKTLPDGGSPTPDGPKADGEACAADADCASQFCQPETKVCATPRNDDGFKNGTETDVDCGGQSGKKCAEGLACALDADCTGACSYAKKCVDVKSCKPHFGGDTCGGKALYSGEFGDGKATATNESCCRSLPVAGYTDPTRPGKQVFVDKYEITAGRVRAFLESLAAQSANGQPDIKSFIAANPPQIWDPSWNLFLASGENGDAIVVPRQPSNPAEAPPWNRNVGTLSAFGAPLYIYVHGHNCGNPAGSFGFPTFFYPDAVLTGRGEVARPSGFDDKGTSLPAQEVLDAKAMTCVPSAVLAAFCHWDGGQLATDEVLDFITNTPTTVGSKAGCGTRCAPLTDIQATADSGSDTGIKYRFPFYANTATNEGAFRIAPPGRVFTDVVRINAADEPWMDLHGNVHEVVLDMTGATFTGMFAIRYRGIGYNSARAGGNATGTGKYSFPEYKAGYAGGRCMRFK